jgi:ribonuclease P protein component
MTFAKSERLCSRKQIAHLMASGEVLFHYPFKIVFSLTPPAGAGAPCCRTAVNVPKRNFKRAVVRNLLKRRTKEAFRKNKTEWYATLLRNRREALLFFHYVSPEILTYDYIETRLREALAQLADVAARRGDRSAGVVD